MLTILKVGESKMKVYLINTLVDNCAWETLSVYKDYNRAVKKLNKLVKLNKNRVVFEICEMELK